MQNCSLVLYNNSPSLPFIDWVLFFCHCYGAICTTRFMYVHFFVMKWCHGILFCDPLFQWLHLEHFCVIKYPIFPWLQTFLTWRLYHRSYNQRLAGRHLVYNQCFPVGTPPRLPQTFQNPFSGISNLPENVVNLYKELSPWLCSTLQKFQMMVQSPTATCKGKMEKRQETKLRSKTAHLGSHPSATNFWAAFAAKILISVHLSYLLSRLHQGSCDHWKIPHLRKY